METSSVLKFTGILFLTILLIENGCCAPPKAKGVKQANESQQTGPCSLTGEFYYNKTKRCYLVNHFDQGPCGEMMVLSEETGTPFAQCKCREPISTGCEGRPLVFWPAKSRCYNIFEQGPCDKNQWLVVDKTTNLTRCEANPCKSQKKPSNKENAFIDENNFTFSHQGKCYDTHTQAFCEEHEKVYFVGSSYEPTCSDHDLTCFVAFGISIPAPLNCGDGTSRDSTGGCSPKALFR